MKRLFAVGMTTFAALAVVAGPAHAGGAGSGLHPGCPGLLEAIDRGAAGTVAELAVCVSVGPVQPGPEDPIFVGP